MAPIQPRRSDISSDTESQQSFTPTAPSSISGRLRVDVRIGNGDKIVVPITDVTTFGELQEQAIARAKRMNVKIEKGDLALRLENRNGPLAFPDDTITDLLDVSDRSEIFLCSASMEESDSDQIYVRWVTPARALDMPTLSAIPTDPTAISKNTTISELKDIARERIYQSLTTNEAPLKADFKIELFLLQCALRTTDASETTLADLECTGSLSEPLNIFVVPMSRASADEHKPQGLWAFDSSERGIATFITCLKVLISKCRSIESTHRRILKTLFKLTHFPPALEALHSLKAENRLLPFEVAILATCFWELGLRVVPPAMIGMEVKSALQGSRQLFAWLEAETQSLKNEVDDPESALVRTIVLEECKGGEDSQRPFLPGRRWEVIQLQGSGDSSMNSSSTDVRQYRLVSVEAHVTCVEKFKPLALALWGCYDIENYYIDFRDNIDAPLDHRRTPLVSPNNFKELLRTANESELFKLKSPKAVNEPYSRGITLSKDGYVSEFGYPEGEVKEDKKFLWNVITDVVFEKAEPGDGILSALEPIKAKRKAEGTWEVDEWETPQADQPSGSRIDAPQEAIVICFDLSYSMDDPLGDTWIGSPNSLTKLTETKQVFENFLGRMVGYQFLKTFIGVITFSSCNRISVVRELSRVNRQDSFHALAEGFESNGMTALYDGIRMAKDKLVEFKANNPHAKLRIIALTDGEDNESISKPEQVCRELYDAGIVLDSIIIGSNRTHELFKMSKHTGGYAFKPSTRLLLFQTFLLEPFLDITTRPDIERVPITDWPNSTPKRADMQTIYDFPPRRMDEQEAGAFVSLSAARGFFGRQFTPISRGQSRTAIHAARLAYQRLSVGSFSPTSSSTPPPPYREASETLSVRSDRSTMSTGRIYMSEISAMCSVAHEEPFRAMDVYVNEADMGFWKVVIEGPSGTPYSQGTFVLSVSIGQSFPQVPPTVRFLTPILHPNITKHGRVCHQVFTMGWRSSHHVHTVLQYMHDLLRNPETSDAVDELATLKFWTDTDSANAEIERYVQHFATKTRQQLQREILG